MIKALAFDINSHPNIYAGLFGLSGGAISNIFDTGWLGVWLSLAVFVGFRIWADIQQK